MAKYFGTDGFRGKANQELRTSHAYQIGRFLSQALGGKRAVNVVIGRDTRLSGGMLEAALLTGLTSAGGNAYLLEVTTTPNVSYITKSEAFDFGVMISASHNPYYDNGIKLFGGDGLKLSAELESAIESYIDQPHDSIDEVMDEAIGKIVRYDEGRQKYIDFLLSVASKKLEGLRIGLDLANGSATAVARAVFEQLGARVYVINNAPNGININDRCGSTHPEELIEFVKQKKLDLGLAFDGDADRLIAVDDLGRLIDGDHILYICGVDLKNRQKLANNKVVTTIMSNLGLYRAFDKQGIGYEKTPVGDKHVSQCMTQCGYSIGGEQSGHIIFNDVAGAGDGILTGIMLIEAILRSGKKASQLRDEVEIFPQLLVNVKVQDKDAVLNHPALHEAIKQTETSLKDEGRILVRPSGTEPLIRVMVEAKTEALCHHFVNEIVEIIEKDLS